MSSDSNARIKAPAIAKDNPDIQYLLNSLVKDDESESLRNNQFKRQGIATSTSSTISDSITERKVTNENIITLFPDIELAIQILVSSVLSPKDMGKGDLTYKLDGLDLPATITSSAIDIIKGTVESKYTFLEKLDNIVREVLFETGAYVTAVLPKTTIDKIISGELGVSKESLMPLITNNEFKSKGLLGNSRNSKISIESMISLNPITDYSAKVSVLTRNNEEVDLGVEIIDNYDALKLPIIQRIVTESKVSSAIESEQFDVDSVYKEIKREHKPMVTIPGVDLPDVPDSTPVVYKLPTESVVPVFTPGDPTDHIGYYIAIDENGYPLKTTKDDNDEYDLSKLMGESKIANTLLQKANRNVTTMTNRNVVVQEASKLYESILEEELISRLKNGVYTMNLELSKTDSLFKVMLARALKGRTTKLLYLPKEIVTYIAYRHYDNGTGRALLDDVSILASLRALLMFSKVTAEIKNSINITHVNIQLDENDPDPQKTIEIAANEIMSVRKQYLPLGINTPTDLVDWLNKAGFEFSFEGHPALPDTKIEIENKSMDHRVPDSDLDEDLRKQMIMALGLSPEMVDNGFEGEFATTVVANNILLAKRILHIQKKITPKLSEHIHKLCKYDRDIYNNLKELILSNKDDIKESLDVNFEGTEDEQTITVHNIIMDILSSIKVRLPKPDMIKIENLKTEYDSYKDSLEGAIDAWISEDLLSSDIAGDIGDKIEPIKNSIMAYYLRKWMADNGYLTELSSIATLDQEGNPMLDIYDVAKNHAESIIKSAGDFISTVLPEAKKQDSKIEKIGDADYDEDSDDSSLI